MLAIVPVRRWAANRLMSFCPLLPSDPSGRGGQLPVLVGWVFSGGHPQGAPLPRTLVAAPKRQSERCSRPGRCSQSWPTLRAGGSAATLGSWAGSEARSCTCMSGRRHRARTCATRSQPRARSLAGDDLGCHLHGRLAAPHSRWRADEGLGGEARGDVDEHPRPGRRPVRGQRREALSGKLAGLDRGSRGARCGDRRPSGSAALPSGSAPGTGPTGGGHEPRAHTGYRGGGRAGGGRRRRRRSPSPAAFAERVLERFGRIDMWINNAGVHRPVGPLRLAPPEKWGAPRPST